MFRIIFLISISISNIFALAISSNDNYQVYENNKYTIIYTKEYIKEAKFIKINIDEFIKENDKSFGYTFDQPLKIVLISNNLQIPNAFSTQIPFNMGIYFNGGSDKNDYFTSSSWLSTLFTHEMVHNYQTNAKKSKISKTLHKYLGNNFMPIFAVAPFFTIPNILLPTAILEGNAVLNESLYNNGGRLHSGRLNALKNSLIFGDKITPTTFINDHLSFPYTQEKYIVGGFYMQYLMEKYGLDKVNRFFYAQSIHSINPLILNHTFLTHFGVTFEHTILDFIAYTKQKYKNYNELKKNDTTITSKDEIYLSKIDEDIYFITTDLTTKKQLNIYNINTNKTTRTNTTLANGKIFKNSGKLYSKSSNFISSKLYKNGLFDKDNHILQSTVGKSIQDIKNNKISYIDINSSFISSKLYIDDKFYNNLSSSALFDEKANIYYFKQKGSTRSLFKNKNKLFEFQGYYSKIVEIKDDEIYFISNSKNGSSLYKYNNSNNNLTLLSRYDNIINAKIITKNRALAVTVTANGYNIVTIDISNPKQTTIPTTQKIKSKNNFKFINNTNNIKLNSNRYKELSQLEFSYFYPTYTYNSTDGSGYMLNALFIDPIMFNMLNIYAFKDSTKNLEGFNYINERYIPFSIDLYNINREIKYINGRNFGGALEVYGPLIKVGRDILKISLKQYFDDKNRDKNPILISLNHIYKERFSLADYNYLSSDAKAIVKVDRSDKIYGIDYIASKHIKNEFYIDIQLKALTSNSNILLNEQRGIEIVNDSLEKQLDDTNIFMEGSDSEYYVKNINKLSLGLAKTFHINSYFSKLPISLRKESVFINYNHFKLKRIKDITIKEKIIGVKFDILYLHKLPIPTIVKYIKNDSSIDDYKITLSFGVEF